MDLPGLNDENRQGVIMILLGLIALLFPVASIQTIGIITGLLFLIIAVILFISGATEIIVSRSLAFTSIILAVLCIIFSWLLMFNPAVVSTIISIIIYILGILMIIFGVINLITGQFFKPFSMMGLTSMIFGILFIILGIFLRNPVYLGVIVGLWLIISGILSIFGDNDVNYIDV
ncbi:DUF308 domain-containing protein [Methanosphaera sp.]